MVEGWSYGKECERKVPWIMEMFSILIGIWIHNMGFSRPVILHVSICLLVFKANAFSFTLCSLIAKLVKNPLAMQEIPVQFLGWEDLLEKIAYPLHYSWASLVAQLVKNPLAKCETCVPSLGWEDPLETGKVTYSSILAWRIPWTRFMGSQRVATELNWQSLGLQRIRHDWATFISLLHRTENKY